MTIEDRRVRERLAQRQLITATARRIAESDGWEAVTTRRLSSEIEYSQPVIYKHFASLEDIAEAVAVESFDELAATLAKARAESSDAGALAAVAGAYIAYAARHPALYDAMFTRTTRLPFARAETPTALVAAYSELSAGVATVAGDRDLATLTEVFWASLHGLVVLERGDRLRAQARDDRLALVVAIVGSRPG